VALADAVGEERSMTTQTYPAHRWDQAARTTAWVGLALCAVLLMRAIGQGLPSAEKASGFLGPVFSFLAAQPFVLLFLTVAAGYGLGKVRLGSFNLGATAATLIVCLTLSLWASARHVTFEVPDFASTLMFNLFMFAVGMKVGPQFLGGLRRDARAFIALGVLVPVLSAGLMLGIGAVFHLAPGLMPGIFAGANTATPGIGAAKDVYLAEGKDGTAAISNLSAAFAFSYCLSLVLFVMMMKVLPRWFGKDAVAEAQAYQKQIEQGSSTALPGTATALQPKEMLVEVRAFEVQKDAVAGRTIGELKQRFPNAAFEQVRRAGKPLELTDQLRIERGDVMVVSGPLSPMVSAEQVVGPELSDPGLLAVGLETVEVVAQTDRSVGKTVGEILREGAHGFAINAMFRAGTEVPFGPDTVVRKGDVFRLTGSSRRIEEFESAIGRRVVHSSTTTDMVTLAIGVSLGALLGTIPIPLFGLKLSLGSAVGLLVVGIVLSILRTRNPAFGGPFPEPARQFVEDLGLNVFIAITALNAGAGVITAMKAGALPPIVVGTLVVGLIPPVIGWAVGQYRHKMNAGLLTGAISGARCSSPGLRVSQEDTKSSVPALSYPVTFAISNVLITLTCYLMATLS
jgi:putative transport protein